MHAILQHRYGPPEVLEWAEVPRPVPGSGQALVRVAAAALNPKDCLVRKGRFRRFTGSRFPRRAGYDFAGTLVECNGDASGFQPGDAVYGMLNAWSGGSYAEYVCAPLDELAPAPRGIPLEDAAGLPLAAQTGLQALRDLGHISAGMRVAINGASGGVGTLAVQLARSFGARVIAICSARNAGLMQELGADEVVDYAGGLEQPAGGFDIFFDVFGNRSFATTRRLLSSRGVYISTVPSLRNLREHLLSYLRPGRKPRLVVVKSNRADLRAVAGLVEQGRLRPVTDRRFALRDAAAAQRYLETKRARGKVLLIP